MADLEFQSHNRQIPKYASPFESTTPSGATKNTSRLNYHHASKLYLPSGMSQEEVEQQNLDFSYIDRLDPDYIDAQTRKETEEAFKRKERYILPPKTVFNDMSKSSAPNQEHFFDVRLNNAATENVVVDNYNNMPGSIILPRTQECPVNYTGTKGNGFICTICKKVPLSDFKESFKRRRRTERYSSTRSTAEVRTDMDTKDLKEKFGSSGSKLLPCLLILLILLVVAVIILKKRAAKSVDYDDYEDDESTYIEPPPELEGGKPKRKSKKSKKFAGGKKCRKCGKKAKKCTCKP